MERRIAATLAADVVGYSCLMESDEAGTIAALKARGNSVLAPRVFRRRGRVCRADAPARGIASERFRCSVSRC
jgi:class 3 adenylate cyclase